MVEGIESIYIGETAVYVVLAILIIAFLFFVINTIRCYLSKPKYVDDDDDYGEHKTSSVTPESIERG